MIQLHELRSAYIYEQIPNFKSSLISSMQPALEGIDCIEWVLDQMSNLYICYDAIFVGNWAREGLSCFWVPVSTAFCPAEPVQESNDPC